MANLGKLISNKTSADAQWREQRQSEREILSGFRDAGVTEVTSDPETFARYLEMQGDNPSYSAGNIAAVMAQLPEATVVGTVKHSKNVHFYACRGIPLTPMPPAGGRRKDGEKYFCMSKADEKGRHHLHIELTSVQYSLLSAQAKSCGLSKRAYLVRLIEGNPVRVRSPQEIKELRWEVHKIGVNINQIARSVNAGIANAEDARQGLYLLNRVYKLMYEIAKK